MKAKVKSQKAKIRTKILSCLLLAVFLPAGFLGAQQSTKVARIGYLSSVDSVTDSIRSDSFRAALGELGYIEGQNIAIDYRYGDGNRERFPQLAAELARLKVDIIVISGGDTIIRAAMNATKTIPILLTGQGSHPVKANFIESLARPGGNVTGITVLTTELGGKRLELLKEAVPKLARVAVVYESTAPGITREVKRDIPIAARTLGLQLLSWGVRDADGLERVLDALKKERPDGLYAPSAGVVMRANQNRVAGFALKSRLPSIYSTKATVEAGGLMYYGADLTHSFRRVATYVDKILKGAKPADLPVEQPTKFELVINLKTAKQIGLTIPPNVLARADKVIR
jgi:putative ABC transport system substrate-binding protein